jgi:hypothetical protein
MPTARQSQSRLPAIVTAISSRCHRSDTSKNRVVGWFDRRFDDADCFGVIGLPFWH